MRSNSESTDEGNDDVNRCTNSAQADGPKDADGTLITDNDEYQVLRDLGGIDMSDIDRQTTEHLNWRQTEISANFKLAQRSDATLTNLWQRADTGGTSFSVRNGLLCRRANSAQDLTGDGYVLVIPAAYEREIIQCADDTPLGGHAGVKRTLQRIECEFYFPRMRTKVARYVKCHECQMVRERKVEDRQPLKKIEVMEYYPFQHITIDF